VAGIAGNVDMNDFKGGEAALQRFAGRGRWRWLVYAALGVAVVGGAWWWLRRRRRRAKRLRG